MRTINFILGVMPPAIEGSTNVGGMNSPAWYIIGALIALLFLMYLLYSLIKPEKF